MIRTLNRYLSVGYRYENRILQQGGRNLVR